MQELIDRLTAQAGVTPEQAGKCIETLKEYIKEKIPFAGDMVDKFLGGSASSAGNIPDDY